MVEKMLSDWVVEHPHARLPVTFDNWFTQPDFCRYLDQELKLAYVGTLAGTDRVNLKTGEMTLADFAERLKQEHLAALPKGKKPVFHRITIPFKGDHETYYDRRELSLRSYCSTRQIHGFKRHRLVINHREADLSDNPTFYMSNRLIWHATGNALRTSSVTRIRRHRWPVEVYHEEGKAEGLDQYQLRDFDAIQRHIALVAVVYSLLRAAQHDPDLRTQLQRILKVDLEGNLAAQPRATQAQSLRCLGLFISAGLAQGQPLREIMAPLIRTVCRA